MLCEWKWWDSELTQASGYHLATSDLTSLCYCARGRTEKKKKWYFPQRASLVSWSCRSFIDTYFSYLSMLYPYIPDLCFTHLHITSPSEIFFSVVFIITQLASHAFPRKGLEGEGKEEIETFISSSSISSVYPWIISTVCFTLR